MHEALERARELQLDVALVDISLGSESGFEVARRLVEADGGTLNVILVSTHAESDFVDLIEEAPVAGFVPKSELSRSAIGSARGERRLGQRESRNAITARTRR